MPQIKRRQFLQFASSTLAAIGLSQFDFLHQAHQYGRVLAQSTSRKLALLIGINGYPAGVGELRGCLTDVELQRQLLIHRFGFQQNDILEVSDNVALKPTRETILSAVRSHIIEQAKPGDVVVIHYSGHGSRIKDPTPLDTDECRRVGDCELNGTMVPIDGLALSRSDTEIVVPDIMGRHLFLLMKAIATDAITVVLDSCHSGAGTRGNANVRSARARAQSDQILVPMPEELAAQERWMAELGMTSAAFQTERGRGIARGVAIGSAQRDELAIDAVFDGFRAGGFTYLLTRYLWQQTAQHSAGTVYINLSRSTERLATQQSNRSQVPVFDYEPSRNHQEQPLYFTGLTSSPAEAVITAIGQPIEFWLGGVSSQNLKGNGAGTVFNILDERGQVVGEIEQTDRNGLYGYGNLISGQPEVAQVDRLLRERIVGIPNNPTLKLGLDPSLGAELAPARTELATVSRLQVVEVSPDTPMDYLLGRFTAVDQQQFTMEGVTELPPVESVGLFSADRSALVSNSFGRIGEPITEAVNRLRPRLRSLLVNQLLSQILTTGQGSPLRVAASVTPIDNQGTALAGEPLRFASRGALEASDRSSISLTPPQFRQDTLLRVQVENREADDLYVAVLIVGADGTLNVLYPNEWDAPEEAAQLTEEAVELTIPGPRAEYAMAVEGSSGFPEFMILASKEPLRDTLKVLQTIAGNRGISRGQPIGGLRGDESFDVINSLLSDLTNLTRSPQPDGTVRITPFSEAAPYDTSTMAVLSGVFEVIPKE
jgi:hypothetical protein